MIFSTLEHIFTHISFSVVSIMILMYLTNVIVAKIVGLSGSLEKGMIATFFCITGVLVTRWIYSGHLPLSDLYESLLFLSWGFSLIHMIPYFNNHQNSLSAITTPSTLFTQVFATSSLLPKLNQSRILVPALQSQWLMMHVSLMVLSYSALLCGSLLSVALLIITFRKSTHFLGKKNHLVLNNFSFNELQPLNKRINLLRNTEFLSCRNYYRYQLIQQLDRWSYRVICLGFIFLTIGILSGAVWANEAWGSYWNWDPKETWAFITWTIFAIYLHSRTNPNFKGKNSALVASLGFFIIWICYFGVNLLGIGLHSYGSFTLSLN